MNRKMVFVAVASAVAGFVLACLLLGRYEFGYVPHGQGWRLNRLTGSIMACGFNAETKDFDCPMPAEKTDKEPLSPDIQVLDKLSEIDKYNAQIQIANFIEQHCKVWK